MQCKAKVIKAFYDPEQQKSYSRGDVAVFKSPQLELLVNLGHIQISEYIRNTNKKGPKIIIYQKLEYVIGGIETWGRNLAKSFSDRDITFIFGEANIDQIKELSRYADIILDDGITEYKCDIFISANYDGGALILDRIKANKYYQTIHSDFTALKEHTAAFKDFNLKLDSRFDKIIAVSDTAKKGLESFGYESVVARNPLADYNEQKPLLFMSMTRASEEKGISRILKMAEAFKAKNKAFLWIIGSTIDNTNEPAVKVLKTMREIIFIEPNVWNTKIMGLADYGVQLSDTEAYCYTIREFAQRKVPLICTPFDEAKKIIEDGKNGYIVDYDLHDLDVDKIFEKVPKIKEPYREELDEIWTRILNGDDI